MCVHLHLCSYDTLRSKSLFLKRKKYKECLRTALNQEEFKLHTRSNSHAVSMMDMGCLPPSSSDICFKKSKGKGTETETTLMVIKRFPLQCGSHLPQCAQWNTFPSHPPSWNPFDFNLDQAGVLFGNCKLQIVSIQQQNQRSSNINIFLTIKRCSVSPRYSFCEEAEPPKRKKTSSSNRAGLTQPQYLRPRLLPAPWICQTNGWVIDHATMT